MRARVRVGGGGGGGNACGACACACAHMRKPRPQVRLHEACQNARTIACRDVVWRAIASCAVLWCAGRASEANQNERHSRWASVKYTGFPLNAAKVML